MPKQNRPAVQSRRLQRKKKRTDRRYLGAQRGPAGAPEPGSKEERAQEDEAPLEEGLDAAASGASPLVAASPPVAAASAAPQRGAGRIPTAVRAIQQQGVRKRRELDLHALAVADTQYALHELRRIAILAAAIVVTLVVLGIVLR